MLESADIMRLRIVAPDALTREEWGRLNVYVSRDETPAVFPPPETDRTEYLKLINKLHAYVTQKKWN